MLLFTQRRNVKNPLWFATRSIWASITYDRNIKRFCKATIWHLKSNYYLKLKIIPSYNNTYLPRTKIASSNYSCCVLSWYLIRLVSFKWIPANSTFSVKILVLCLKLKIKFIKKNFWRTACDFLSKINLLNHTQNTDHRISFFCYLKHVEIKSKIP